MIITTVAIICFLPFNTLGADMAKPEGPKLVGNEKQHNPTLDQLLLENNNIRLELQLPKTTYRVGESINMIISILNLTSYKLFYVDIMPEFDFSVLVREKNQGSISLNEFGTKLKHGPISGSITRVRLYPRERGSYEFKLTKTFDFGEGSYEVIALRQLRLPTRRSFIDKLFHLNEDPIIDLSSKPIKFEVLK